MHVLMARFLRSESPLRVYNHCCIAGWTEYFRTLIAAVQYRRSSRFHSLVYFLNAGKDDVV